MPPIDLRPVALAMIAAALAGCGSIHAHFAQRRHPPQGRLVETGSRAFHVVERSPSDPAPSGPTIVCIHGSVGSINDFTQSILVRLGERSRAIAYDRPGHGFTRRPRADALGPRDHARALHDLLDAMGVERPVLVGHSWGAAVALAYALEYPGEPAALVLIGPVAYGRERYASTLNDVAATPVLGDLFLETAFVPLAAVVAPHLFQRAFGETTPPPDYVRTLTDLAIRPAAFRAESRDMRLLTPGLRAMSPRYSILTLPVTIIAGADDRVTPPELQAFPLHADIPGSRLVTIPAAGHVLQFTHPEIVLEEIERTIALQTTVAPPPTEPRP